MKVASLNLMLLASFVSGQTSEPSVPAPTSIVPTVPTTNAPIATTIFTTSIASTVSLSTSSSRTSSTATATETAKPKEEESSGPAISTAIIILIIILGIVILVTAGALINMRQSKLGSKARNSILNAFPSLKRRQSKKTPSPPPELPTSTATTRFDNYYDPAFDTSISRETNSSPLTTPFSSYAPVAPSSQDIDYIDYQDYYQTQFRRSGRDQSEFPQATDQDYQYENYDNYDEYSKADYDGEWEYSSDRGEYISQHHYSTAPTEGAMQNQYVPNRREL